MAIMSPISPDFKMLQKGLTQMQNNVYEAYILKVGSNLFTWNKVGLPLDLYQKGLSMS
jgi:hypothetical protein